MCTADRSPGVARLTLARPRRPENAALPVAAAAARTILRPVFLSIALSISGAAGPAGAQVRPDARTMTCPELQTLVRGEGAVVITIGPFTYDRFVASRRYCLPGEMTVPALTETLDRKRCRAGYHCVMRNQEDAS